MQTDKKSLNSLCFGTNENRPQKEAKKFMNVLQLICMRTAMLFSLVHLKLKFPSSLMSAS